MTLDALEFARQATGLAGSSNVKLLDELRHSGSEAQEPPSLSRTQLAGRLVELSARGPTAVLSVMAQVLRTMQDAGEPAAWIGPASSCFFPPDLARRGIDLAALVVVRIPAPARSRTLLQAAERLLRSGAFGMIIIDGGRELDVPLAAQGRLAGLAQQHDTLVLCLTDKSADASSLGSMVSLRLEAVRRREPVISGAGDVANGNFPMVTSHVVCALKDKRRGPGWSLQIPSSSMTVR